MKKSILIFLFLLAISSAFIANAQPRGPEVSLQGALNPETGLPGDINDITEAGKKLTDEEQRKEYLKKEWGKILEKNKYFDPIIEGYRKISPYTDPIFKYTIGMVPSLSWLFALTFFLWLTFLIYIYIALSVFSESSRVVLFAITLLIMILLSIEGVDIKIGLFLSMAILLFAVLLSVKINGLVALLASLVIPFVLTAFVSPIVLSTLLKDYKPIQMLGIPKFLALAIISLISLSKIWWVQVIVVVLVIVGLILLDKYSITFKEFIKKTKEKMAKKEEEMNRELLREDVKKLEKVTKVLEK